MVNAAETAYLSATRYDAYGLSADGYDSGSGFTERWGFQGRLDLSPDADNPLYEFSARFYSPALGVFTQLDSYPGDAADPLSLNRYLYAHANPWTFTDPTGHWVPEGPSDSDDKHRVIVHNGKVVNPPPPPPAPHHEEGPDRAAPSQTTPAWASTDLATYHGWDWQERGSYAAVYGDDAIALITSGRIDPFDVPIAVQLARDYLCTSDPQNCDQWMNWLYQYMDPRNLQEGLASADRNDYGWWAFYQEHRNGPSGSDYPPTYLIGVGAGGVVTRITPGGNLTLAGVAGHTPVKGGVYTLRDPVSGQVVRTGRTSNLSVRRSALARDPVLGNYVFQAEYYTDVYAEQRGLEQVLWERHPEARVENGGSIGSALLGA